MTNHTKQYDTPKWNDAKDEADHRKEIAATYSDEVSDDWLEDEAE
jgi:hypothetical protein